MSSARTIAIGDIHGCDVALETVLNMVAPQPEDVLVILGDVIDRGPGTRHCLDLLIDLRTRCRVVHLMGNHEEMFLDSLSGGRWKKVWPAYGGLEMLESYGGSFDAIPEAHLDFIRSGKDFFETPTQIFVHAMLRPNLPPEMEEVSWLRWARFPTGGQGLTAHFSGRRVVCGHTAQRDALPAGNPHYLCIDTNAYASTGLLTALDTEADVVWQAGQSGFTQGPVPLADLLH